MTTKTATVILVALLAIGGLLLSTLMLSVSAGDAVKAALAEDTYATSAQRSTTVCVGLFNFGCDTAQTSTTTTTTSDTDDAQHNPFELLIVLAASAALLLFMAIAAFRNEAW